MIKALLIGCGNIGAGYDLDDDTKVWTHAKAYSLRKDISLTVFDEDHGRASMIASKYGAQQLDKWDETFLSQFDIVSITTPTTTHFDYLYKGISRNVPVIICEKPVVENIDDAEKLEILYNSGKTRILVNYIRRFQPAYATAKDRLQALEKQQSLKAIIIKYKRGFLNNASHALDLLEFFFETPCNFADFYCSAFEFDAFDYDPTLTGSCKYMELPVSFIGTTGTSYGVFEMELFFGKTKVVVCHSGNDIRYYYEQNGHLKENISEKQSGILDDYMIPVIKKATGYLKNKNEPDNFMQAVELNKKIIHVISGLGKKVS